MLRTILTLILFTLPWGAQGITFEMLSHKEKQEVFAKKLLMKTSKREEAVWPDIDIFASIDASPLEAIAIFLALDIQKQYIPGILISTPIRHISPTEVYTKYLLDLPWPIPNSEYIHGSDFKKTNKGYRASWYLVKSDTSNSLNGYANFFTLGKRTLLHYHTFISPKSSFAKFLKGMMVKDTKKSLQAIVNFINLSKKQKSKILEKYVSYITRSLNGENVYQPIIDQNKISK